MQQISPLSKSIATVSLSGTLADKLEAASAAGFDAVEIFENDLLTYDGTPREVARLASNLDLKIVLFQPFRDFEGMEPAQMARNFDRAARKFDVMGELETDLLLVCSNVQETASGDFARCADDLAKLAEMAAGRGMQIAYEALAWGKHVNRWRQGWALAERVDNPAFGIALDSFHTLALGDTLAGIEAVPAEKIGFIQLADAPKLSMDVLSWSRHFRNFPGQGDLDVTGFLRTALAAGYSGPLSLEIFNDNFRAGAARPTAVDGLRSLLWVEAEAGRTQLPPPPESDGFEFVEFAVDEPSRGKLASLLTGMGFHHAGRHRSKAVSLYRQGQINIVLNAEPDSAAAEHFIQHGTAVCALALKVDNVAATLARAEALACPTWAERTGPGEHQIPAIRVPDGALLYLVGQNETDKIWQQDFILGAPAPMPDALQRIDHIALALSPGSMDRFVLFYRTIFGLTPEPTIEYADWFGLVRSRTMKSLNGKLRIPLNTSESADTATSRFVSASDGAGVHHIAFETPDATEAMRKMHAHGVKTVAIPPNYYDDIAARFGLDDQVIETLRNLGILFDRDNHGDFRHAYTPNFEDRFFFEIVERGDYQGYGASNAPIRLAAQARLKV